MLDAGVGLLRTLPPAAPEDVAALRRSALALGRRLARGRVVRRRRLRRSTRTTRASAALLVLATRLLRGAGYTAFDGAPPEQPLHSGVALPYAHCTAPLRRLADRHVGEVCVGPGRGRAGADVGAGRRCPRLPEVMTGATRRAGALERAVVDGAEALVLSPGVGERFDGGRRRGRRGRRRRAAAGPAGARPAARAPTCRSASACEVELVTADPDPPDGAVPPRR